MQMNASEFGGSPERVTPSQADLAWLAGIVEGEGSVCLLPPKQFKTQKRQLTVRLVIPNSDLVLLEKCRVTIESLTGLPKNMLRKNAMTNKPMWTIDVNKQESLLKVLLAIEPYMVGEKKWKALKAIAWLRLRATQKKTRVTPEFMAKWAKITAGVETERSAPSNGVKPQSELHGNMQRAAEMPAPLFN